MMVPNTGRSRHRIRPAATWLIKAFAPGCPTMLREWTTRRTQGGQRLTIVYDLPDGKATLRAEELVNSAPALVQIAIGRTVVRDLEAEIHADHATLTVNALLVTEGYVAPRVQK